MTHTQTQAGKVFVVALSALLLATIGATAAPTVTLEQALGQDDPTNDSPIAFEATFSEPVAGFDADDVFVGGTGGTGVVTVATSDDVVFAIEVFLADNGSDDGTTVVSVAAGSCVSVSTGEPNAASTSLDNAVLYDTIPPAEPMNAWPSDEAVIADTTPTFSWEPVVDGPGGSGVKNYRVTIVGLIDRDTYKTTTSYTPQLLEGAPYKWRVYARDHAGNTGSYTWRDFRIDVSAPINPTASSATHTPDMWSSDSSVEIRVSDDAWDLWTDIEGFEIAWNQSSTWIGSGTATHPSIWPGDCFTATGDEDWWFHLSTVDTAGNWSDPIDLGPFRIDASDPANPTLSSPSHEVSVWSDISTVEFGIDGAYDAGSGVDGFEVGWSQSSTWEPTQSKEHDGSWTGRPFTATEDGDWYVHLATVDRAGNWAAATSLGPFRIDTTPPTDPTVICTSHIAGVWSADGTVRFAGFESAADGGAGIAGTGITWSSAATGIAVEEHWADATCGEVVIEAGDGSWYLTCQTTDMAGNRCFPSQLGPFMVDTTAPIILDIPEDQTVMVPHGDEASVCSWEEPTADDALCGLRILSSDQHPGDRFPIGTTTVTYTAIDQLGNTATASFEVTVAELPQQLFIVASGEHGGFLDRCPNAEQGEGPPIVGCRRLEAVYVVGEPIVGRCGILDAGGESYPSSYIIVSLYAVDVAADPEVMTLLDSWNAHYDLEEGCYRFEADTTELAPGIYDLRLGFEDGSTEWIRAEVIDVVMDAAPPSGR